MRMMHTMLRVTDLEASLGFYCEVLEMQILRRLISLRVDLRLRLSATVARTIIRF